MKTADRASLANSPVVPNGPGAAALLSAGIGCVALAVLAFAADKSAPIKSVLNIYKPTGALSGVTTAAILIWLLAWAVLEWRWGRKTVAVGRIGIVALALLGLSFLLTFPPFADFF